MHESMEINDEIYSRLDEQDIRDRIEKFGKKNKNQISSSEDTYKLFQEFLEWQKIKNGNDILNKFNCLFGYSMSFFAILPRFPLFFFFDFSLF